MTYTLTLPNVFPSSRKCSFSLSLLNFSRSAFWIFLTAIGSFTSASALNLRIAQKEDEGEWDENHDWLQKTWNSQVSGST